MESMLFLILVKIEILFEIHILSKNSYEKSYFYTIFIFYRINIF